MRKSESKKSDLVKENEELTTEEIKALKGLLPFNYVKLIKEKLVKNVSSRTIIYVLNGDRPDRHLIIETAIKIAHEEKERKAMAAKNFADLTK